MTVLLTGYEPFGDHDENPSGDLAAALDGETIGGHDVVGRVLPVEFDALRGDLIDLLDEHDPDAVLGLGLAAGRNALTVERVGVNVAEAGSTPDNADATPHGDPLDGAGADAHLATIPVEDVAAAMLDAGVPARVSNTAGTHCCNAFLYHALSLVDDAPAGFVHVPLTPAGAVALATAAGGPDAGGPTAAGAVHPSLSLNVQRRGVEAALDAIAPSKRR